MTDCYICYEKETSSNKFVSNPCQCKGTNKIHLSCLKEVIRNNGSTCTICKSEFSTSDTRRKEESRGYRVDSMRHPPIPVRHEPIITMEDYEYSEAPIIDSVRHPSRPMRNTNSGNQHPENSNTYYRGQNIEIYTVDMGNGNYQIHYRPKHDCCTIC